MEKTTIDRLLGITVAVYQNLHHAAKNSKFVKEIDINGERVEKFAERPRINLTRGYLKGNLIDALTRRKSKRTFRNEKMSLRQLSLFFSNSVSNFSREDFCDFSNYPLNVYFISLNTDLDIGVYYYSPAKNCMVNVSKRNIKIDKYFVPADWNHPSGIIFFTADIKNKPIKNPNRVYKNTMIMSGIIAQRFYLAATALGIAICAVGGFVDEEFEKLLDLNPEKEMVTYVLNVG